MESKINQMKLNIAKVSQLAGEGHIPSAYSILDMLWILYDRILQGGGVEANKDKFILSKGHASLALYAVLQEKGIISSADFESFAEYNSILGGHPDATKVPGVFASTGSLGHGLPMAVGMALASKIKAVNDRTYCLVGDGECNEGTVWEAVMLASHHNLNNLYCIVDYNHSTDRALKLGDIRKKFEVFGWDARVINGHDHEEIFEAFSFKSESSPIAIIAETIKGKGVKFMESQPSWHHKSPNDDELKQIAKELGCHA